MQEEIWKPIEGYKGVYMISNYGRVKSTNYRRTGKESEVRLLKNHNGYLYVILYLFGKRTKFFVHRLVAEYFIKNETHKPHVDHIDGIRHHNMECNLRWCTVKENHNYKLALAHHSVPVIQIGKDGKIIKRWYGAKAAANDLGIKEQNIIQSCRNQIKTAGGYIWQYADKESVTY